MASSPPATAATSTTARSDADRPAAAPSRGCGNDDGRAAAGAGFASRARANSPALANRSAGVLSSALATAASIASGTALRTTRRWTGRSVISLAIIACAVGPVTGGSPASISYSTAASE